MWQIVHNHRIFTRSMAFRRRLLRKCFTLRARSFYDVLNKINYTDNLSPQILLKINDIG